MTNHDRLARVIGVPGAVLMGLGSIIGTGIFVSVGVAAGVAGSGVVLAVALAAMLASCNALSSAQLAASHPVSGGTYEYGYKYLDPRLGFVAGWMFLCAKTASAATAALGFAGYALAALDIHDRHARIAVAVFVAALITIVVAGGAARSNRVNAIIVSITLAALAAFIIAGIPTATAHGSPLVTGILRETSIRDLLHATALMFVAFTGYGRIATLGEEVARPETAIPRAIVITLLVAMALYLGVVVIAIGTVGAGALGAATRDGAAPLEFVAEAFTMPQIRYVVALGAMTAMLGVLLNLVLGLSRVLLAMARRGDMPPALARIDVRTSPRLAVIVIGLAIGALASIGSVETTWSFSAFTVLLYYAITNLAALRLDREHRRFGRWVSVLGFAGCLGLAFWVEPNVWLAGLGVLAAGLIWRFFARRWRPHAAGRSR